MTTLVLPESGLIGLAHLDRLEGEPRTVLCHETDASQAKERFPGSAVNAYSGTSLTPSREDLADLAFAGHAVLVRDEERPWGWDAYVTAAGLLGADSVTLFSQSGETSLVPPRRPDMSAAESLLLVASGGIGNLIQATPLLAASLEAGLRTFFCPVSDGTGGSLAGLFDGGLDGLEVIGPEALGSAKAEVRLNIEARNHMVPGEFFHSPYREPMTRHEGEAYAQFFRNVTGLDVHPGRTVVGGFIEPVDPSLKDRIVLCPGSKPGWDSKRWPYFASLAERLAEQGEAPVILCREPDLEAYDRLDFLHSLRGAGLPVTDATLPRAAAILRAARGVVANDCGLAHMAAATGARTLVLFGPSSLAKNRPLAENVRVLSLGLDCQPCQGKGHGPGRLGPGEFSCEFGYPCLRDLSVERVLAEAQTLFNASEVRA
eukprot:TRINITY_DN7026_c0_g1_i2.p1 TRINITY_DN7026_c0_g1~~TRINITY_DN7026_c0_g1_i2.p1  ORF type:complete len:430 (-),score=199.84 TRINITY_DN7026_c0_g1_i2:526-1815(-)